MKRKIAMATMALIPLTATSAFAGSKQGIVTATSLNVRSGPSTSNSVLFSLKKNEKVDILESSNGWYKISTSSGKTGWASSEYINTNIEDNNQSNENKKVVTASSLNMRSGASTSYRVIFKLSKGTVVEVISENNGWSKIKYDGRIGYVSSEYLSDIKDDEDTSLEQKPSNTPTTTKVVTATSLNVRSGASTSASIVGKLKKNDKVEVISESNGWSKIKFEGKEAYVSSEYLSNSNSGGSTNPTPEQTPTTTKVVTATSLNVRSGASTSASIVGKLKKNDKVEVISESNGWSKIKFEGKEAYVSSEYLSNSNSGGSTNPKPEQIPTTTKVVTATSLNVRSGASTSASIVGKLKKNDKVEVISESNGWSKIKFEGKEAYVSSEYLSNSNSGGSTNPTPEQTPTTTKVVTATSLNVRSGASTSASIVGKLKKNDKVEVISESNGWSKIKFEGKEAYVSSEYLSNNESTLPPGDDNTIDSGDRTEIINGATVRYKSVSYTLAQHVDRQYAKGSGNMIDSSRSRTIGEDISTYGFVTANKDDLKYFMNPANFVNSKKGMLQFLRLDSYKGGITASELNAYLNSLKPSSTGSNVFYNQGQAFIDAAKKYNIDLVYLVAHSMVETGYGTSTLAKGQVLTSYKGKPLPSPVKVYNFFGIGAFDGTANLSGAEAAYANGWTSVEATIEGSAKWIASNYIHSSKYGQNTLYKMRWSYENVNHQYATDVNWANVISGVMYKIIDKYDTASNLTFEVPIHKK